MENSILIAAVSAFGVAFLFNALSFPKSIVQKKTSFQSFSEIISKKVFWLFAVAIFFGGGIESAFTFWATSFVGKYLSEIPRAGAIAVMIFALSMFIGRLLTAHFTVKFNLRSILITSTILGIS